MIAWITGKLSAAWIWAAGALVALGMLLALYASIFKSGQRAAQVDALETQAKRNRAATQARIEAMKPITKEKEDADEFNRDHR
jgi:hypothetical protein